MADAEDVLAEAWVHVLIEVRDRRQAKARGAAVRCERARRALDAALVLRDPDPIAAAHADLEQTLLAAGAAHDLYAQAHHRVNAEVEQLWWRSVQRKVEACVARNGPPQAGSRAGEQGDRHDSRQGGGEGDRPDTAPPPSLLVRLSRRAVTWMLAASTCERRRSP